MKNLENIKIDGIDHKDCPDYADAYISYAEINGIPLNDDELERVNDDADLIHSCVIKELYG